MPDIIFWKCESDRPHFTDPILRRQICARLVDRLRGNVVIRFMKHGEILAIAGGFVVVVAFNLWSLSSVNGRLKKIESPDPVANQLHTQLDEQIKESEILGEKVSALSQAIADLEIKISQTEKKAQEESFERKDLNRKFESQTKVSEEIKETLTEISRRLNETANEDRINRNALAEQEQARLAQTDKEAEPIRAKIVRLEEEQERILARIRVVSARTLPPSNGAEAMATARLARELAEWKRKATDDLENELQPIQRALEAEYARLDALKRR